MVKPLRFSGFVLDANNGTLSSAGKHISLTPKDCALLYHLAANAGRLISHAELMRVVWPDTAVGPDVLKVRVAKLRRLLADDTSTPRFIVNHHGEGYRFIPTPDHLTEFVPGDASTPSRLPVVGRESEFDVLNRAFRETAAGRRQMLFITGEAGIGKTTLVDAFVDRLNGGRAWVGRGQCIEHYGSGEPYLPVMEALSHLGRNDKTRRLSRVLERYAPSWLVQLPSLLDVEQQERIRRRLLERSRERMPRELAEALEALEGEHGDGQAPVVVLVLEDLHWADVSTLDLLQLLARRRESARLLVLGTYRSLDDAPAGDPLRRIAQALRVRGAVTELPLERFCEDAVTRYLDEHLPGNRFHPDVAALVYRRTAGHPLFLADLIRVLLARGVIDRVDTTWTFHGDLSAVGEMVPSSLIEFFARQRDELMEDDQRLLEAASVAGLEFPTAAVAAALDAEPASVEERCLSLARRQNYLQQLGSEEWPDGTRSMRFGFPHALHQELWKKDISHRRAEEWQLRIAKRQEEAYGDRAREIAPELASRFEQGRDYRRAVLYGELAGQLAMQRAATVEAKAHLKRALDLLTKLSDASERLQLELRLQIAIGSVSALAEGYVSADAVAASRRAHDICRETADSPELIDAIFGLSRFFWVRGELARAHELGEQMVTMAKRGADPVRTMAAHAAYGNVLAMQGETAAAASVLREGLELARIHWRDDLVAIYGGDLEMMCAGALANVLQVAGFLDQAVARIEDAIRLAEHRHPVAQVSILYGAALFRQLRHDPEEALRAASSLREVAAQYQLAHYTLFADVHCGWALAASGRSDEGITRLVESAETLRRSGAALTLPQVLLLLADVYITGGDLSRAGSTLDEAFAVSTRSGKGLFDAELHRLHGELKRALDGTRSDEAETAFRRALSIARAQGTKLWELRAALSLARMWRDHGRAEEAHRLVSDTYGMFTEGFDTPDLTAARAFLEPT